MFASATIDADSTICTLVEVRMEPTDAWQQIHYKSTAAMVSGC